MLSMKVDMDFFEKRWSTDLGSFQTRPITHEILLVAGKFRGQHRMNIRE